MKAILLKCNLEGIELLNANFQQADLTDSYLTGSIMPCVNFRSAKLRSCGLAEIEWEHADLRNADLAGASFHMGSTAAAGWSAAPSPAKAPAPASTPTNTTSRISNPPKKSAKPTSAAPTSEARKSTASISTWSISAGRNTPPIRPSISRGVGRFCIRAWRENRISVEVVAAHVCVVQLRHV